MRTEAADDEVSSSGHELSLNDEIAGADAERLLNKVEARKNEGNLALRRGCTILAAEHYSAALDLLPIPPNVDEVETRLRQVLLSNRSAAKLKLGDAEGALRDARACAAMAPNWTKAHFRCASALMRLKNWQQAIDAFDKGLQLDPGNAALLEGRGQARRQRRKDSSVDAEEEFSDLAKLRLKRSICYCYRVRVQVG